MSNNYFIVNTPLQYLLAIEIIKNKNLKSDVLVTTNNDKSLEIINNLSNIYSQNNVRYFHYSSTKENFVIKWVNTISILIRLARINIGYETNIYVGHINNPFIRKYVYKNKKYNITFFDEGSATIKLFKNRSDGDTSINLNTSLRYFNTLFYPKKINIESLNYITIYPGLNGTKSDRIETLVPQILKSTVNKKEYLDECWVIGSPMVDRKVISNAYMIEILEKLNTVCRRFKLKFKYFPHRVEKYDNYISPLTGVDTILPGIPFEIFYAHNSYRPRLLITVSSTAVININLLFGENNIVFVKIKKKKGVKEYENLMSYVNDHMKLNIIDINDGNNLNAVIENIIS